MSDLITFRLSANHARALVALGTDHTAPALARAAADLVWQQISGPVPVTDPPKRRQPAQTLRPLPGKDYSGYSADPLPTARACALLNVLSAAGAADPLGMARALTGRDITGAEQISEREGMQLLHILQARAAQVQASAPAPTPQATPATITRQRARELHKELANICHTDERYAQARRLTGRPVESLTALTEEEARALLDAAHAEQQARDNATDPRHLGTPDEQATNWLR